MPANWGAFIPALANTLQSQQFTKPGGAKVSYDPPEIGATKVLGKDFKSSIFSLVFINNFPYKSNRIIITIYRIFY